MQTLATHTQSRRLTIHPAMIYDIIARQSGTLSKAIMEGVMNSADAGATRCDVTITDTEYFVTDDGKGFRDQDEIVSFFETFGTPHAAGDATFGRYRIGRGQGFSFGVNQWLTGCFDMRVDIKGRGLDYDLAVHPEPIFEGCCINVALYDRLSPGDLAATIREVRSLCEWMPIPVYVNGALISKSLVDHKWDIETDDYVIKRQSTGGIKVYNIGAFVRAYSPYDFGGFNGIVISKRQLQVNFARNDVLASQCSIFREIKEKLRELSGVERKSGKRLSDDDRAAILREIFEGGDIPDDFMGARIFPAFPSRYVSLRDIRSAGKVCLVSPLHDQRIADRIKAENRGDLVLLRAGITSWVGVDADDIAGFALALTAIIDRWHQQACGRSSMGKVISAVTFDEASKGMKSTFDTIPPSKVSKAQALALETIHRHLPGLVKMLDEHGIKTSTRACSLGSSTTAMAWTDGATRITFDKDYLNRCITSLGGFQALIGTALHELMHSDANEDDHVHDEDFYRSFHDMIEAPLFSVALKAAVYFARQAMRNEDVSLKIARSKLARELDELFNLNERLSESALVA